MRTKKATKLKTTYPLTGARLQASAATFDSRRKLARMIPTDYYAELVQRELDGLYPETEARQHGGILGKLDRINANNSRGYVKFRPRHWTRRQLYNRVKWLRGELTRIITREKTFETEEKRFTALMKRRDQIAKYERALEYYAPLHAEVRRIRELRRRPLLNKKAKATKRKVEIATALAHSRALLQQTSPSLT